MRRAFKLVFLLLLLVSLVLPMPGLLGAVSLSVRREMGEKPSGTREYATIARHLRQTFHGYGRLEVLEPQFGIVALSHMAAGLYNVFLAEPERRSEVTALVEEVVRRGLSAEVSPLHRPTTAKGVEGDHNLFWSHLGVILGVRRMVQGPGARSGGEDLDAVQRRIVSHLHARTIGSAGFVAPSYPGSPQWPADQTVTLLAIRLHDEANGTSMRQSMLLPFQITMGRHTDAATGLFHSSLSRSLGYAKLPRGCATSWSALYLAQVDPMMAYEQYRHAREHLKRIVLGVGGFREWLASSLGHGADVDSGPIVLGVGMAATALGLGPSRLFGDAELYAAIRRSALTFGLPSPLPSGGHLLSPVLGEAILFHGRTARPWFGAIPKLPPTHPAFPTAPLLLLLLDVACLALFARWRVRRLRAGAARSPSRAASKPKRK